MSYSSRDDVKEQIREAIDIVELVSRYVPLRRIGRNYVGRCPWHDDSRPSLQVNPERQSYKCWVCNVGGDIFSFIMQLEKVDFREALEILADIAGVELPTQKATVRLNTGNQTNAGMSADSGVAEPDLNQLLQEAADDTNEFDSEIFSGTGSGKAGSGEKNANQAGSTGSGQTQNNETISKRTLYQVMDWVQKQYHEALLSLEEAAPAREYLKERGINEQSIRQFSLGYSPLDGSWLIRKVENNPRRIACLEAVGVLGKSQYDDEDDKAKQSNRNQMYDRFRGRLLFPIRDTQDRTIAFGGRVIPGSPLQSRAKYVNSPETVLFSKQRQLYGLDVARLTMRNTRRALIMEGYTDCIMTHQAGIGDAVAVLGTALGTEHIKILKRFVDRMVLVLDGDTAGQKRANEVLELFVAQGVNLSILTLPAGADPCEFILINGKDKFEEMIDSQAVDALEHAFLSATNGVDLDRDVVG
ncbi:MAG: DNA primase, partial [Thermoguttaceae bacterium]